MALATFAMAILTGAGGAASILTRRARTGTRNLFHE